MRLTRPRSAALIACAAAALAAAGCGSSTKGEPVREGLGVTVADLKYTVYITRELNQHDAEDRGYYRGPEPGPGFTYYGVFVNVCNEKGGKFRTPVATDTLVVTDNQENEFKPLKVPADNVFAYRPRSLSKDACVPEGGSAAATGPTAGALLIYKFPVQSLENRPLILHIEGTNDKGELEKEEVKLDL